MNTNGIIESNTMAASGYTGLTKTSSTSRKGEVGTPKLSEKAQKYYEKLKKKFSNMEFILVSEDKKQEAQANLDRFKSTKGMVVLIDTDKVERMAEDESYRKQYEGIISGATSQLAQIKNSLGPAAGGVKTFGMKFNDGGNASFFAVIDKSLASQKKRIEKKAEEKTEAKKAARKKEKAKQAEEKKAQKGQSVNEVVASEEKDTITVTASSLEELLKKIQEALYGVSSGRVKSLEEQQVGQKVDFAI